MSDFILDLRPLPERAVAAVGPLMRWFPDIWYKEYEFSNFSLAITCPDQLHLWGPYQDPHTGILVVVSGRIACDDSVWREADALPGAGGLAAKLIYHCHIKQQSLDNLFNGAFTLLICDPSQAKIMLVTDPCGMQPVYYASDHGLVLSSHTDLLAKALGTSNHLDQVSLAEFLMTGRVSYPYSYYTNIKALDLGSIYECKAQGLKPFEKKRTYFTLAYNPAPQSDEDGLVASLGAAFRRAVQRRTLARFGKTAISLSGGLDSRTLASCATNRKDLTTFTFFDEENYEFNIASRIAKTLEVPLVPLRRDFEHYAQSAIAGTRIQGGMGSFVNNHFLGFRDRLREMGIDNILAGFYCDYLFKGLGHDKTGNKLTGLDRFSRFSLQWYRPRFEWPTALCREAIHRHQALFADIQDKDASDLGRLRVEGKRLFPLAYEPDNAETVITQRALPWYLPTVDTDLIKVYLMLPPRLKLNNRLFAQMVVRECGPAIAAIPDSNTGLPVGRLGLTFAARNVAGAVARRLRKFVRPKMATQGSWPDWQYYAHHSRLLDEFWMAKTLPEEAIFEAILGSCPLARPIPSFRGNDVELLARLLTLRLWFRHRIA